MLTVESEAFPLQQAGHHLEALLHLLSALGGRDVEALKFLGLGTSSDAQLQTPAAQNVDQGGLLGQTHRIMERHDADGGADSDLFGSLRDGERNHQGVGTHTHARKVVLGQKHGVVAEFVGHLALFEQLLELVLVGFSLLTGRNIEKREFHVSGLHPVHHNRVRRAAYAPIVNTLFARMR